MDLLWALLRAYFFGGLIFGWLLAETDRDRAAETMRQLGGVLRYMLAWSALWVLIVVVGSVSNDD